MFIVIDVTTLSKVLRKLIGKCALCGKEGQVELIMTYKCFRLFFIPLLKWDRHYFIRDIKENHTYEISEDDAILLQYGQKIVEECCILKFVEDTLYVSHVIEH